MQSNGGSLPHRRRQNKSCDQCREGKRRCDVKISNNSRNPTFSACSNCSKWKKQCTIEWIYIRHKRAGPIIHQQQQANAAAPFLEEDLAPMENMVNIWNSKDTEDLLAEYNVGSTPQAARPTASQQSSSESGPSESSWRDMYLADQGLTPNHEQRLFAFDGLNPKYITRDRADSQMATKNFGTRWVPASPEPNMAWVTERSEKDEELQEDRIERHALGKLPEAEQPRPVRNVLGAGRRPSSPFTSQLLAEDHQKLFIKEGLLKIYHDSLEGALSCWLTERNCPYTHTAFDGKDVWSSKWTNRIVTRVCELDKAYSAAGILSRADQHQASTVLNLVVMAFAAQWSQTGERGRSRLANTSPSLEGHQNRSEASSRRTDFQELDEEPFDRNMQKSLWYKAHQALSEASGNSSFRVIFAGVIFALTQRPIEREEVLQSVSGSQLDELEALKHILDLDGPPIFLDIALRKLHDHQRRLKDAENVSVANTIMSRVPQELSTAHKESFFLLYWLAVMFDTLSAAVNRRAFTVCDVDSSFTSDDSTMAVSATQTSLLVDLDGWSAFSQPSNSAPAATVKHSNIWGDFFLHQQSQVGQARKQNIRWPCSYIDSAACLADAAPVKVLLFRRVGHLQDFLYRRSAPEDIEKAIDAVMEVYDHWNNTYGLFIDDCIQHHEDLPARIQSWYILLAGHWNLAVLILADLIEKFDDAYMTMLFSRCKRQSVMFTRTLRIRSAVAVSDLGRCSRYGEEDLSFSQTPDFHYAVNKAALLTEPWTMVLVRSFGLAGAILAKMLAQSNRNVVTAESMETRTRLQYCVDALWLLGKKSDMALCAAQVLQKAAR